MESAKVKALTADMFKKDMDLESPCEHPETQVTFIQGSIVLHCKDSILNEGSCEKMTAFRLPSIATLSLTMVAKMDPEKPYVIGLKCERCNEGNTGMEMLRDLHVHFSTELDALQLTCQCCGEQFGNIPISSREDIN